MTEKKEKVVRQVDVIIVGGGPAGLTAAIYAARAGLKPIVAMGSVDGSNLPGGQLMITTEIENFPGTPVEGLAGPDLMEKMKAQAIHFGSELIEEFVTKLEGTGPFTLTLEGGSIFSSKAVIIASGASARWLHLPQEDKFRNNGVSACATCDGPLRIFRNKHLIVVGGGDTAMEEALFLTKFASKVTIVHRRVVLRASQIMSSRAQAHGKIEWMLDSKITKYLGAEYVTGVAIENTVTGETTEVECAGVFVAIGHIPNTKWLEGSGVQLGDDKYVVVKDNVFTNIDGIFACGDVHDTIYRQGVTAAGFGCMAAITATRWLEENQE